MKVVLKNRNGALLDITELIAKISWKGSRTEVARSLELDILTSSTDAYVPKVQIELGNLVLFYSDSGKELFRGFVFFREKSNSAETMSVRCFDPLIYLLKNKGVYNFKKQTPEQIVKKVCSDYGIPAGHFAKTGVAINRIFTGDSLYDIIMTAYTLASKQNGRKYILRSNKGKAEVIENGAEVVPYMLTNDTNIINSTYSESIENMVNTVKIIDDKKKVIGEIKDDNLRRLYGVFTEIYQKEDKKNPTPIAKSMLKGVERSAKIEGIGNVDFITGRAVMVEDRYTGLVGKFYIDADEHTWENGIHKMNLTLTFEKLMDTKESGEEPQKQSKKTSQKQSKKK